MSHVRCPMCGKDCALSTFHPELLDDDIYVRQAISRGYRQGFEYSPDTSVMGDDEITPKVIDRCIALLKLSQERKIIDQEDLMNRLGHGIRVYNDFITWRGLSDILSKQFAEATETNDRLRAVDRINSRKIRELTIQLSELEKEIEEKKRVDQILGELQRITKFHLLHLEDEWMLLVPKGKHIEVSLINKRLNLLDWRMRQRVAKRIITENFKLE